MMYLIRHGQTVANTYRILDTAVPGSPLTELGHEQARNAARAFLSGGSDSSSVPIAVYHGPATRTKQTATELCATFNELTGAGLAPQAVEGTYEIQAGDYEGQRGWPAFRAYQDVMWEWAHGREASLPGGETLAEFTARFRRIVEPLEEGAMLVAHGAAIRMITLLSCHDLGPIETLSAPLENCGVVTIERTGEFGEWTLHGRNEWRPQDVPKSLLSR